MAVIEALMSLFVKELVTADRVVTTIKRFENMKTASEKEAYNQSCLTSLWIAMLRLLDLEAYRNMSSHATA